jgi:hypothetical protein
MRKRKKYPYKDLMLTIAELYELTECTVTLRELQCNIWKRKLPTEKAIKTQKTKRMSKCTKKWFYQGLFLTLNELAELGQCKVSVWVLRDRLNKKVVIESALVGGYEKFEEVLDVPEWLRKEQEQRVKDNLKHIKEYCPSVAGSISFSGEKGSFNKLHTYQFIVCRDRFGLEIDENGLDMEKTVEKYIMTT